MTTPNSIGPYTITRELGRGGMGVVYLAHDPRLDRDVAIKELPAHLAVDAERLARFEREARSLAGLSHPNVAGIFGVEDHTGARYLILEYVPGATIAERLDGGPIPVDDAVEIAAQIAAGVDAAHESGVIHRDLKPANVIVTDEGTAKVLDFGLARADEGRSSSSIEPNSATLTTPAVNSPTIPGVIMGTAAYMSPEQARGRTTDRRTDVWSFGVVLYEMLTGVNPFIGETVSDSIGAILHTQVDHSRLPQHTPSHIRRVIERCLQRDKKLRYSSLDDARHDLLNPVDAGPAHASRPPSNRVPAVAIGIAAGVALLAGLAVGFFARGTTAQEAPARETLRFNIPVGTVSDEDNPAVVAVSPSERLVAWAGKLPGDPIDAPHSVCIHDLVTGVSTRLDGTENATTVYFSPDGSEILFLTFDTKNATLSMNRIPARGGPILTIFTPSHNDEQFNGSSVVWRNENEILVPTQELDAMLSIDIATGDATRLGELTNLTDTGIGGAATLADDDTLFLVTFSFEDQKLDTVLHVIDIKTLEHKPLLEGAARAQLIAPDVIAFTRGKTLCVAPYDAEQRTIGTPITPVVTSLRSEVSYTISETGDLFAMLGGADSDLRVIAAIGETGEPEPLIERADRYESPIFVTEQGSILATVSELEGRRPIARRIEIETGFSRPMSTELDTLASLASGAFNTGEHTLLAVTGPTHYEIVIVDPTGNDDVEYLYKEPDGLGEQRSPSATPDGRYVIFTYLPNQQDLNDGIYMIDRAVAPQDRLPVPVMADEDAPEYAELSPDGEWLAYVSDATGSHQVYVRPFDPEAIDQQPRSIPVTFDGGRRVRWAEDGRSIYYLSRPERDLMAADFDPRDSTVSNRRLIRSASEMNAYHQFGDHRFDFLPDGRIVYVMRDTPRSATEYAFTLNWTAEVLEQWRSGQD